MQKNSKGFTIIELLVVVAIIAVLASIVLVNVTSYISKSKDAAIKGNMATIMTNSAVYYDTAGNYTGFSTASSYTVPVAAITAANTAPVYLGTASQFCVTAALKDGTTYCVDSTGAKGTLAGTNCAGTDYTCF